jgi:hypothetical protein
MTYLDSTHFSKQFSYKIRFIPSYHSKDMNLTRYKHFLEFLETEKGGTLLTKTKLATRQELTLRMKQDKLRWCQLRLTIGVDLSEWKIDQKDWLAAYPGI